MSRWKIVHGIPYTLLRMKECMEFFSDLCSYVIVLLLLTLIFHCKFSHYEGCLDYKFSSHHISFLAIDSLLIRSLILLINLL
jgi:hypothetical protein